MEYFKKNIETVPSHIPILVIANFRDVQAEWKISSTEIRVLVEELESIPPPNKENVETDKAVAESLPTDNSAPAENTKENSDSKVSNCFMGVAGDFLHHRRVIKFIETSFMEKFGLHVCTL